MRTISCQQALPSTTSLISEQSPSTDAVIPVFHIYGKVSDIPFRDWQDLVPITHPFLRYDFLAGIEAAAQSELEFRYVLVYQNDRPVCFAYFQLLTFEVSRTLAYSSVEKAKGGLEKIRNLFALGFKQLSKNWQAKLLIGGNVFLSSEGSHYHLDTENSKTGIQSLIQIAQELKKREKKIKGILLKDFYQTDEHPQELISEAGFHSFLAEPNMLLHLKTEWKSFEDYLAAMSSKYRQRARSAYKKSQAITSRELSMDEVEKLQPKIYELFKDVIRKNKFAVADAGPMYFTELKRALGSKLRIDAYYLEDELVAFMSTIKNSEHLEAHFLGFHPDMNRSHKIYQRILYDIVRQGIQAQLSYISFGRTALEIKSCVGAIPHDMNIYLKLSNSFFNRVAAPIMRNIRMDSWQMRHPFK